MTDIADAVAKASGYLRDHPDDARYRDAHALAVLGPGLHVEVSGPGGERLATDMPRAIGGAAVLPSPGWYFRAAAASCVAALIGIRAAMLGVALAAEALEVTVDSELDDRGILGTDDQVPAGALSLRVSVSLRGGSIQRGALEAITHWAVEHCPVTDTARREVPIEVEIR